MRGLGQWGGNEGCSDVGWRVRYGGEAMRLLLENPTDGSPKLVSQDAPVRCLTADFGWPPLECKRGRSGRIGRETEPLENRGVTDLVFCRRPVIVLGVQRTDERTLVRLGREVGT